MRKQWLTGIGAAAVASVVLLSSGCGYKLTPPKPAAANGQGTAANGGQAPAPAVPAAPTNLLEARRGFQTRLLDPPKRASRPPENPPPRIFQLIRYTSSAGQLAAYLSPDPADNKRHAAVLWAHGGSDGIGGELWEPGKPESDQSVGAFWEAGLIVMCPSWRGENDNPGRYEMFYGEVEDLVAALDHLARLPYVDPQRIYLAGHNSGGTLALLGAEATRRVRAAFSLGGAPDLDLVVKDGRGYGNTPFDFHAKEEAKIRSPIHFLQFLGCPAFYFEGEKSPYGDDAMKMQHLAGSGNPPFRAFIVSRANHLNLLDPLTRLIARKVVQDTGLTCNITFDAAEVQQAFDKAQK